MKTKRWHLKSGSISEYVYAPDQWAAMDTLRDRGVYDFGLIVVAEPNEDEDNSFPARTSLLMYRWGRENDAKQFIKRAIEVGMPDTSREDR